MATQHVTSHFLASLFVFCSLLFVHFIFGVFTEILTLTESSGYITQCSIIPAMAPVKNFN